MYVEDGIVKKGDVIQMGATGQIYTVSDCGIFYPEMTSTKVLGTGQVGFISAGIKTFIFS